MIVLDTSALFALMNRADPDHRRIRDALKSQRPPYVVPAGILAEICYLLEQRLGLKALSVFLNDIEAGSFSLDCGQEDIGRIRLLAEKYADLPLGFSDSCVVACAQRNATAVLTTDADFHVVAKEGNLQVLP
ncbi:MAG: type II toxin-antitoxin system VapC family toxin [Burkholderiales bacterium]